jgi:SH3-like domain-containing protein
MTGPRSRQLGPQRRAYGGRLRQALGAGLLAAVCGGAAAQAQPAGVAGDLPPQLALSEAFVELHTGPGRGYPVVHVAARGEVVQLLLAHTAWIKLRTASGREGWVRRDALQGTLQAAGIAPTGWQRWVDTNLRENLSFGAAWGRFQSQPMLQLSTRLRLSEAIHVEATAGQVQGLYSGTDFWRIDALVEPLGNQAWSPRLAVGVGRFRNVPNASLVEQGTTNANLAHAGIGIRWRFGGRYEVQADYGLYTALLSDQRSREYRALTLGLSFHF